MSESLWTNEKFIGAVREVAEDPADVTADEIMFVVTGMIKEYEARLAALEQQDSDWLAMLRAIAKIADKMEAEKAEPDNEWSEADDATLLEQFDPWQTLREVETSLEQAAPVSAWEVTEARLAALRTVAEYAQRKLYVDEMPRPDEIKAVGKIADMLLEMEGVRLQRPATAAGEEE